MDESTEPQRHRRFYFLNTRFRGSTCFLVYLERLWLMAVTDTLLTVLWCTSVSRIQDKFILFCDTFAFNSFRPC